MPDLVGTAIGQYQIVDKLGRGGTATVYKGYQTTLGRYVAIKVLEPSVADEELFLSRFQREARAVALLRHPNIVQIYDFGNIDDMYYMVMEYIDGQALRTRLKSVASQGVFLPTSEVLAIIQAIASALDYAHKRGIVHRDVKPGNILLSSDGQSVLGDFGIAQMVETNRLTLTGLVGTPFYMSPEQGQGLEVDRRTDIYSLGIVTYEMLTNQIPFSAETPFGIVTQHVSRPLPSLAKFRPELPPSVQLVLNKATAKLKEQRYDRAVDMADQLKDAFHSPPAGVSQTKEASSTCAYCGTALEPGQRFCPKCGTPVKLTGPEPITRSPGKPPSVTATASAKDVTPAKGTRPTDTMIGTPVRGGPSKPPEPALSAGNRAPGQPPKPPEAILPQHDIVPVTARPRQSVPWVIIGGAIIGLIVVLAVVGVLLNPFSHDDKDDEQTIVAVSSATASAGPATTVVTQTVSVSTDTPVAGQIKGRTRTPVPVALSPGVRLTTQPTREVRTIMVTATTALNSTTTATAARQLSGTVTSQLTVATTPQLSGTVTSQPTVTHTPQLSIAPIRRLSATTTPTPRSTATSVPSLTATLTRQMILNPVPTLYIGIPAGTQAVRPVFVEPTSPGPGTPTLSPTEAVARQRVTSTPKSYQGMIVFKSDRDGKLALYVMNADGSSPTPLPDPKIYDEAVNRETLSPDGKERLRVLDNSGNYDIYMGPADEHKPPMAITSHAAADYDPAWSPQGDKIAFVSLRTDGKDAVFVMTPDGRNDRELTFNRGFLDKHPTWSPDASQIAFGSNRDGHRQVYVMNADGSGQKNISNNAYEDYDPVWLKY